MKLVEKTLADSNRYGQILLVPNRRWEIRSAGVVFAIFSRKLEWSREAFFFPVSGAPRIEYGDASVIDLAHRWLDWRHVHGRWNAPQSLRVEYRFVP